MGWFKGRFSNKSAEMHGNGPLRSGLEGLYVSEIYLAGQPPIPAHQFLRFDGKGNLLGVEISLSSGSIDRAVEEFSKIPSDFLSRGKLSIQQEALSFTLVGEQVIVDYVGRVMDDRLMLHWRSRVNDHEDDENFWFVTSIQSQLSNAAQAANSRIIASDESGEAPIDSSATESAIRLCQTAWTCDENGDVAGAIHNFDLALRKNPADRNAYYGRGVIYCKTRNYTIAIADLNYALRLNQNFPAALAERGMAFLESGYMAQAMLDYDQAIRIDPTYAVAHINKGSAYALQSNWAEALRCLSEGIQLSPRPNEDALINRAIAYEQLGDLANAASDLRTYLRAFPQGSQAIKVQNHLEEIEEKSH